MSLITQSPSKPAVSERDQMIRHGQEKAQKDFAHEEAENLIRQSYQEEMTRLRKGKTTASEQANPTKSKEPSPMQRQLNLERSMQTQAPLPQVKPEKPVDSTLIDGPLARRVLECWNSSSQARKDFPDLAAFYDFCVESDKKNQQLPPHLREIAGLPFYQRSINLEKGRMKS